MILKLILDTLELDLSSFEFVMVEENNWLTDKLNSKYTYPVDIDLTPEQSVALGNITEQNLSEYQTLLEARFYAMGQEHEAVFEIERNTGKQLIGQIRYGLEEFPNFEKELSALPLEVIELGETSIYDYAETIINQTWPAVNFNFPQVITDKFDTDTDQWAYFEGIVNNYVSGAFLENEYDDIEDVQINRNIIQPLPYLLHILKKGFEDVGKNLVGEILDDVYFKKATIYALSEFYYKFNTDSSTHAVTTDQYDELVNSNQANYSLSIPLPSPGRYKIAGNVYLRLKKLPSSSNGFAQAKFRFNNSTKWQKEKRFFLSPNVKEYFYSVDFNIDYTGTEGDIEFTSLNLPYNVLQGDIINDAIILDVTLTQLSAFDVSGNLIPTLVTPTEINLPKCVPSMKFGEFVNAFAKWHNYGIVLDGNNVIMNKKVPKLQESQTPFNLQPFEVKFPERNFNQGKTFTYGFFEVDSEEYNFPNLLIGNDGYQVAPFTKNDDTEEIVINALPLPLKQKGEVLTAHGFLDDNSKALVVIYEGLTGGLNISESAEEMSALNSYLNHHQQWFTFLLKSIRYVWSFMSYYEEIFQLKINDVIYAYKQYHIIRRLSRKNTTKKIIETEIETETLN